MIFQQDVDNFELVSVSAALRSLLKISLSVYSRIFPSMEMVTTCHGMNYPLVCNAFFAVISKPPQQGTSIRRMVTL